MDINIPLKKNIPPKNSWGIYLQIGEMAQLYSPACKNNFWYGVKDLD